MPGFEFNEMQKKSNGGTEQICRMIEDSLPSDLLEDFQIIPSRVGELKQDKIRVYHLHDLPEDPEANHLKNESSRNRFHKLIFCGQWQYDRYISTLGIPPNDKCAVIDNPISPIDSFQKSKDEIRLIYTSTPQRGLELLVPVFEKLCETRNNIHLDVFSSFSIYGWVNADEKYKDLFDRCRNHPKITYHGAQPNNVVREHLQKAHIFAYPSIWQETSCRSLIEAMSAQLLCIHPNFAGLAYTSGGLTSMYQFENDVSAHANKFYHIVNNAIDVINQENTYHYLRFVKAYADNRFSISKISGQWEDTLRALRVMYPDDNSRLFAKKMFTYKV